MSDEVFIGRVKWVRENSEKNYRYAVVVPLVQSSPDQKRWIGSIKDPVDEFPSRGLVYWHEVPRSVKEGDHIQFEVEPHPFYKGEPDREGFQIRRYEYPKEIIDLRDIGSERDIRILLTTKGVSLNANPLVGHCVLWIRDEKWVGPVELIQGSDITSWTLALSQQRDSIPCRKIPAAAIQQVELEGTRYLLPPNQDSLGQPMGFVTWVTDEVLAKRVLNRLRKRDKKAADALTISTSVFKECIETIGKAGFLDSELDRELSFSERVKEILDTITKNEELLNEASNICFANTSVKQEMHEKAKKEYEQKLSEYEAQLDINLAAKRREIEIVELDLKEKGSHLASLEDRITTAERELAKKVSEFEIELTERLRKIAEKPERMFAEMAYFEAITSAVRPACSTATRGAPRLRSIMLPETQAIREPNALVGALSKRLLKIGVSPHVGQALHCALSSGTVPVVIGPDSLDVVRCYADCASSGILHWIPIGGALFEPSDLFGRVDPSSHSFIPHPGGLLDLLLDNSDAVHLVVLDGFNRAAADGYLLPLLQLILDEAKGCGRLTMPLVPHGMVHEGESYSAADRVAWSPNVLLVLRPAEGISVLPVPHGFWAHCAVINTESPVDVVESPPTPTTRVSKEDWNRWLEQSLSRSESLEKLTEYPKARARLPRSIRRKVERIRGTGVALGLNSDRATDQALKIGLVPYLVTCDEPMDEWLKVLGLELDEQDRRVEGIVRRLGE